MSIVSVDSEIGRLEGVILLKPGNEVERMTPDNAKEALYSDILNKRILQDEYTQFYNVLSNWTKVYEVHEILEETLAQNPSVCEGLVKESCKIDNCEFIINELKSFSPKKLATVLIEGYEYNPATHAKEYEKERYCLKPLYNFFFTRDIASVVYDSVLINPMASKPRVREQLIINALFTHYFKANTFTPFYSNSQAITEGGDILIARHDTICIGNGKRTNTKGIQFLVEHLQQKKGVFNIVVQELPDKESFIHLDMVFTFLDKNYCMAYAPLIEKFSTFNNFQTTHIQIDNGSVTTNSKSNLLHALKDLSFDLQPIYCGGVDTWFQDREQWHSGANFFALGEGKIIGYGRNDRTIEALSNAGFTILPAKDFSTEELNTNQRVIVTINASELPRGGGGARCMTLPIKRAKVNW